MAGGIWCNWNFFCCRISSIGLPSIMYCCCCCAGCQVWLHNPKWGLEKRVGFFVCAFFFLGLGRKLFIVLFWEPSPLVCFFRGSSETFLLVANWEEGNCHVCNAAAGCLVPGVWQLHAVIYPSFPHLLLLLLLPQEGIVCGFENCPEVDGNRLRFLLLNQNALVECGNPMC